MNGHPNIIAKAACLRASVSLAAVISEMVDLKRSGRHAVGLCPFHQDRTPSFQVYEDHFHCFGCGAHGDVFDWLMVTRRISFPEAVQRLSENRLSGSLYQHPRSKPNTAQTHSDRTWMWLCGAGTKASTQPERSSRHTLPAAVV
jgi:DNA primase